MINNRTLSNPQFFILILVGTYGSGIYHIADIIEEAGRTAWLVPISFLFLLFPLLLMIFIIGSVYPSKNFLQIIEEEMGFILGRLASLILIIMNLIMSAFNLSLTVGLAKTYLLNTTPVLIPIFIILLLSTLIAGSGIESIGRTALFLTPVFMAIYVLFILLALINFKMTDLMPFLDKGFLNIFKSSYLFISMRSELFFFSMIMMMHLL